MIVASSIVRVVILSSLLLPFDTSHQVSASDKASGKTQKITITSDKGRLSEDEIARMVREAEENAEADKNLKSKVEAKNQLESYLYNLRASLDDEKLKDKFDPSDKETLDVTVKDALTWLDDHPSDEKDSYDSKRKEVEKISNPIIAKIYSAPPPDGAGMPPPDSSGKDAGSGGSGPTVEEVD